MIIQVNKLTNRSLLDIACSFTAGKDVAIKDLKKFYKSEHSPIRTQIFEVFMYEIPTFASVHFTRHKVGVEHFVTSNRDKDKIDRETPVNHMMVLNAQSLISMARKRLCRKADPKVVNIMRAIVNGVHQVDKQLSECMVADCLYRGQCYEIVRCTKENKDEDK